VLRALGRVTARHARWFLLVWLVLTAVGFGAVAGLFGNEPLFDRLVSDDAPQVPGPARTGQDLLARAAPSGPSVQLVLDGVDPASPVVRTAVVTAAEELGRRPEVGGVAQPYAAAGGPQALAAPGGAPPAGSPLVAADGRAVLVVVRLAPGLAPERSDEAVLAVEDRLERVADEVAQRQPGATGQVGGTQSLIRAINSQVKKDLGTGEAVALPVSLVVMVFVFGGLLAAGLPVAGAIASIAGGLFSLLGFSYAIDLSTTVPNVVSVMGLGLCIDYGLLLVSRYREELRRLGGSDPDRADLETALERTLASAGRTVLFSAVTVAISLSGLMFFRAAILRAIGAAGVSVVLVALLVALTLVPALLAAFGARLIRPGLTQRIWGVRRLTRRLGDVAPETGNFSRLAHGVQRRPALVALAVVAVLLFAGAPALSMHLANSGYQMLPRSAPERQLFEAVAGRFPAAADPAIQVVSREPVADLGRWAQDVAAHVPGVASVDPPRAVGSGADRVSAVGVRATAGDRGRGADELARTLQERAGDDRYVTGFPAYNAAFLDDIRSRAPLAAGVVVLATFVLLFLMTGSVLVPAKALVMNTVSLGASFGVLVWVFQEGHLEGLLQFTSTGGIDTMIPALVLAFAFGLSMDYEVFLLSRIKELRDAGATNDEAVAAGLQRSGRIITSAALVVVLVFAGFASGKLLVIKQMGIALAVAVAVDATLVRMLLVPATMTLLGEWNWWAPGPLRRLHARFGVREG
jgi:putative drug exporter of the RND superfamily